MRIMTLNHGRGGLGVGARDAAGWSDVVAHGVPGGFGPATRVMPGAHLKREWLRWSQTMVQEPRAPMGTQHLSNETETLESSTLY